MNDPLKSCRLRLRQWQNDRRLHRERDYYNTLFRQRNLSIPDDDVLRADLKKIFPGIVPKSKGQLNIVAIYRHYNWENYSLKPALEKFGTVLHYDWGAHFNVSAKSWRRSVKAQMNRALLETVQSWAVKDRPDIIFMYVSGEVIEPDVLAALRAHGAPLVNLALNDKEHFVGKIRAGRAFGAKDICRYFDLSWTSTEDALAKYVVEGANPLYLPEGANPDIHKPYDVDRTIDVSFVGQRYGNRQAVIDELTRRGIVVEAYGFGWPRGPLSIEEMVRLYSQSRINLGFGGVEGHRDTYCLKGRDFEIPMSGGLYLTEDHHELYHAFRPGKEILTYTGIDDLEQKIRYYLAHPDKADAVRKKGFERARQEHTWEARFNKIFDLPGLLR
ncbi:MAG: glycosyltransferase [Smithellaceae bacterium]